MPTLTMDQAKAFGAARLAQQAEKARRPSAANPPADARETPASELPKVSTGSGAFQ